MSVLAALPLNSLFEEEDAEGTFVLQRVLHVDLRRGEVAVIEVANPRAMPVWRPIEEVVEGLGAGTIRRRSDDPFSADTRSDEFLSEAARRTRDKRWGAIGPLVDPDLVREGEAADVLRDELRGSLVRAAQAATGCGWDNLYKWLRLYWRRGQTPNALLPEYDRCGGAGQVRTPGTKKRGRPRKVLVAGGEDAGLNVDSAVLNGILGGARRYLYRKHRGRAYTYAEAYQATLEAFFREGVILKDGVLVPVLLPPDRRPTYQQFRYWAEKHRDQEEVLKARYGARNFHLKHRPVLGSSEGLSRGPGHVYQIDSTVADLYLVSSLDRSRIVGRPILYFVVDHWTRMVVGFHVALEGPSYAGAAMALANAFADKVAFCKRYGRDIQPEDWPCHHISGVLVADRGELLSNASDDLVAGLGLRLSTTAPWRADWKAFVESQFRLTNEVALRREPGWVDKARNRGDPDYRLDAILTVHEFTQLIIDLILLNNATRGLRDQVPPEFPLPRDADPTPLDLWEWGTEAGRNMGRVLDPERVRITLLPSYPATSSRHGLGISNRLLCYDATVGREQGWFLEERGRQRVNAKLKIDPNDVADAYLWLDGGRRMERCQLTPKYETRYAGRTMDEVVDERERRDEAHRNGEGRRQQKLAEFHARQEHRDELAEAARRQALGEGRVIPITAGQREARRSERDELRRQQAQPRPRSISPPADESDDDDYIPFPS